MAELEFVTTDSAEILAKLLDLLRGGTGELLRPGDERRIFAENLAVVYEMIYNDINIAAKAKMLRYASGDVLDALGERLDVLRIAASPAKTTLVFSLSAAMQQDIFIPQGTRVTADGNNYFATDENLTIPTGDTQGAVDATSAGQGEAFNHFDPGSLNILVDPVGFVQGVENITTSSGGNDTEDDEHYRDRIQKAPGKLSTAGPEESYIYWALTADADIMDVSVTSPAPCEVVITALMNGGELPNQAVLDKIYDVCNGRKRRPMTDLLTVQAPTPKTYSIDITYYVTAAGETEAVRQIESPGGALDRFAAWQKSKMGRDINPDKLIQMLVEAGALRVDIAQPAFSVVIGDEVAIWDGNLVVSHHISEE